MNWREAPEGEVPLSGSRPEGRALPDVLWFNPCAEGFVARGLGFAPVKAQAQLARDLANLPQFLGSGKDIVLVPREPARIFLDSLQAAGFELPEFVVLCKSQTPVKALAGRRLGRLRPWAWSPEAVELFNPLFTNSRGDTRTASQCFNPSVAQLYNKAWSQAFLRSILEAWQPTSWLCGEEEVGVAARDLGSALGIIADFRSRGIRRLVCKQGVGVAGHGALRLWEAEILPAQRRWLEKSLSSGGMLVIESWQDRLVDFSVQLEMRPDGLHLLGYTGLDCDHRGQFRGNWAEGAFRAHPPSRVSALLRSHSVFEGDFGPFMDLLLNRLESELRERGYLGPLGIDAFVYRDRSGVARLKPVVEINPRHTMGRVLVELMSRAAVGMQGIFRLIRATEAASSGGFGGYAAWLQRNAPVTLESGFSPRIKCGTVCLNDPKEAETILAVFHVGSNFPRPIGSAGTSE